MSMFSKAFHKVGAAGLHAVGMQSDAEKRAEGQAHDQAAAEAADMQARKDRAIASVNALFGVGDAADAATNKAARDALYAKTGDDVFSLNKNQIDQDREVADRNLGFALARAGQTGSSIDTDQHALVQKNYDKGILDARNLGDTAATQFRNSDASTRANILGQLASGIDEGTALSTAANTLKSNFDTATANERGQLLSNAFNDASLIYNNDQNNQGVQSARALYNRLPGAYFNAPSSSGTARSY
jgi:hypothetical protein